MAEILVRNDEILWRLVEDKVVILDMDEAIAIMLNDVGSHIWTALQTQKTKEELINQVIEAFDADKETVRKDVHSFLNDMIKRDLIRIR